MLEGGSSHFFSLSVCHLTKCHTICYTYNRLKDTKKEVVMKKIFVLFVVLVVIMGTTCSNNSSKPSDNFQVIEDPKPTEVYRGVTTGVVTVSGPWARIRVEYPRDQDVLAVKFRLDVLYYCNGTPAISDFKNLKAGEELLFSMDGIASMGDDNPGDSYRSANMGYFRKWSKWGNSDFTILNPPVKK